MTPLIEVNPLVSLMRVQIKIGSLSPLLQHLHTSSVINTYVIPFEVLYTCKKKKKEKNQHISYQHKSSNKTEH